MSRVSPIGRAPRTQPPQRRLARSATVPAPVGGINAVDAAAAMPVGDAFDLVNMVGGRAGLTSRLGFSEWCIGMSGNPIRSVVPFQGSTSTKDRLFACSSAAIFDCTTSSQTPTSKHTFGTSNGDSGFGASTVFTTSAGHFLFYADETNGLLRYDESTDAWQAAPSITGVTVGNIAHVSVWQNRILLTEKNTGNLWYLPTGAISGAASALRLGNRFPHGGTLVGAWPMTRDGGAGVDDYLVVVSTSGDVLIWQGTDPATAGAFTCTGTYFVGAVPKGRRIVSDFGGDLLILSLAGVFPVSRMITGTIGPDVYTTRKIQSLFNSYGTASRRDLYGWALTLSPEENCLLVNLPLVGNTYEQLAMSLATSGWSIFRERPSLSGASWKGAHYFGTYDGRLCKVTGDLDDVKLSGAATYDEVDWSGVTSFQNLGNVNRKTLQQIRPRFLTQGAKAGYGVEARYDFDATAIDSTPSDPATEGVAQWGVAQWGVDVWPGVDAVFGEWRGATGSGTHVAIAFRGRSNAPTTLMGFDVTWTEGGVF